MEIINNGIINVNIFDNGRKIGFMELSPKNNGFEIKRIVNKNTKISFIRYVDIEQSPRSWSEDIWEAFFICLDKLFLESYTDRLEAESMTYALFFDRFNLSIKHSKCNSNENTPLAVIRHILSHYCKEEKVCNSGSKVGCKIAFESYKNFLYYTDHRRSDFLLEKLKLENNKIYSVEQIRNYIIRIYGDSHFYKIKEVENV